MSCTAVNSLVWFRGLKLMSAGGLAVNVKGPDMVSRSWVPMATRVLLLRMNQQLSNTAKVCCAFLIKYFQRKELLHHFSIYLLFTLCSASTWWFWNQHIQSPITELTCRCFDGVSPAAQWSCRIAPVWRWCLSTLLPQHRVALLQSKHSRTIHFNTVALGFPPKIRHLFDIIVT